MVSSTRQAIACALFIFIAAVSSHSQVTPAKNATASISGKVTLKNKGLAGIVVIARDPSYGYGRANYRATTDQAGNYRIPNIVPGTYQIGPSSPGWVVESELSNKSVVIEDGENLEGLNYSLVRGGVITGKITDADGRPVIEEQVFFQPVDGAYIHASFYRGVVTDDRGIYRCFGLGPGKYKVYVGQGDSRLPGESRLYRQTFYPSVTDADKATLVEVTEGSEAGDIDITMGRPMAAFKVTGKIVDAETGKPIPNVRYGIHQSTEGREESTTGSSSDANGDFRFDGVMPGKYSIFIVADQNIDFRAEWVQFEVSDRDVTGLLVKAVKGASVSGVVVLEGAEDSSPTAKLVNLYVHALLDQRQGHSQESPSAPVGADGSFKLTGLPPGVVNFAFTARVVGRRKPLSLVRVERDGILQPNSFPVKDGEQISGLKLVIKSLTASIRGQVKVEDGELPPDARMSIWLQPVDDGRTHRITSMNSSPQIDSRGRFLIEGIAGGTYEINIAIFESGRNDTSRMFKQQVTVADNAVTEVTVMVKLKP